MYYSNNRSWVNQLHSQLTYKIIVSYILSVCPIAIVMLTLGRLGATADFLFVNCEIDRSISVFMHMTNVFVNGQAN